jgi:hypothetical protein
MGPDEELMKKMAILKKELRQGIIPDPIRSCGAEPEGVRLSESKSAPR